MSDYEEPFEEETPTTSEDASHISTEDAEEGRMEEHRSRESSAHQSSGGHSGGISAASSSAGLRAAPVAAAAPLSVPLPVPVAQLPAVVPVPLPQPVITLGREGEESDGSEEETAEDRAGGQQPNHSADSDSGSRGAARVGKTAWAADADAATREHSAELSKPFASTDAGEGGSSSKDVRHVGGGSDGTASASTSILTGAAGERRRAAQEAAQRDEFQQLTKFVAFVGSGSVMSSTAATTASASLAGAAANRDAVPLTLGDLLGAATPRSGVDGSRGGGRHSEQSLSNPQLASTQHPSPVQESPQEHKASSTVEEDPSSVFSTVSQHLKPHAASPPTAAPAQASAGTVVEHSPAPQAVAAPSPPAVPLVKVSMPALPPSSFAAAAPPAVGFGFSFAAAPAGDVPPPLPPAAAASVAAPPLDPKLAELRETSQAVERLVRAFATLRGHGVADSGETAAGKRSAPALSPASTAREGLQATTMHRVGASATIRPTREEAGSAGRVAPVRPPLTMDEKASVQANEALMEEALLSCVLEMLQDDLGKAAQRQRMVDRVKAQPPHVTVSAADFAAAGVGGGGSARRRVASLADDSAEAATKGPSAPARRPPRRDGPFSVFDGSLRAFDPAGGDGGGASEALFHSVQDNLQKYVLRHVVDPTQPPQPQHWRPPAPSPGSGAVPTPVTAHFAWLLLLDLLAVCTDVVERGLLRASEDGAAGLPRAPVVVRYNGERHCELLARNAIHCLPFEVMDTAPPAGEGHDEDSEGSRATHQPRRRPLFRLEYWVTRAAMFTVMDAVRATIRHHLVHMANTAPYAIFATDINPYVNARVLAPTNVPMFRVVLDGQRRGAGAGPTGVSLIGAHRGKQQPGPQRGETREGEEEGEDFFGVSRKDLGTLAFHVSGVATDLLEKRSAASPSAQKTGATRARAAVARVPDPDAYRDLTHTVTETVKELLDDAGIRAAVERRALEKFDTLQKTRREYPGKARLERERIVIERAEKDAEDLIRKIAQEMLIHEAGV